jgi:hypothetical protein
MLLVPNHLWPQRLVPLPRKRRPQNRPQPQVTSLRDPRKLELLTSRTPVRLARPASQQKAISLVATTQDLQRDQLQLRTPMNKGCHPTPKMNYNCLLTQ